ncbi:MAG: dihydrodipicolinate synthase family protein [Lentisphaeria bacterium]
MQELALQVRQALTGPFCSIPTPFTKEGEIDYPTVAKMIDFQISSGFKMIFLTPGNSHFNCLRDKEIAELCRFTAETTKKRALTCVCNFYYGTKDALEFGHYAKECGADLLLTFPPNWAGSITQESIIDYYVAVAEVMPLMMIYPSLGPIPASTTVIEQVIEKSGGRILAVKDDSCTAASRQMTSALSQRCAVFSGGQKQNFLNIQPYGATGFLSTIGLFKPEITWKFWQAYQNGDWKTVMDIVVDIDIPFFNTLLKCPGSFDAGIHAIMEIYGFGKRCRRAPYYDLNDKEMETLRDDLGKINLI